MLYIRLARIGMELHLCINILSAQPELCLFSDGNVKKLNKQDVAPVES